MNLRKPDRYSDAVWNGVVGDVAAGLVPALAMEREANRRAYMSPERLWEHRKELKQLAAQEPQQSEAQADARRAVLAAQARALEQDREVMRDAFTISEELDAIKTEAEESESF